MYKTALSYSFAKYMTHSDTFASVKCLMGFNCQYLIATANPPAYAGLEVEYLHEPFVFLCNHCRQEQGSQDLQVSLS